MPPEIARAAGLGAVQGLTEFLPVSSSGHLALAETALGLKAPDWLAFDVAVHLATLSAVLVAFRREIVGLLTTDRRLIPMLAVATVPAVIAALLLGRHFEAMRAMPPAIAGCFVLTAVLLVAGERASKRFVARYGESFGGTGRPIETVGLVDSLLIGLLQALAIAPGVSRSGATISGGLLRGIDRRAAVTYSFLLSIPAILGAAVLEARQIGELASVSPAPLAAGFAAAFVSGLAALKLLVLVVDRGKLHYFAGYCLVAAASAMLIWAVT